MSINKKILAVVLSTVMVAGSVAQVGPCFAAEELNQTQRIEQNQTTPVQIPENKGTWDRTKDAAAKGWDKTKKVAQEYPKLAGAAAGAAAAVGVYAANQVVCKTVVEKRDPRKPFGRVAKVLCKGVIRKRAAKKQPFAKKPYEIENELLIVLYKLFSWRGVTKGHVLEVFKNNYKDYLLDPTQQESAEHFCHRLMMKVLNQQEITKFIELSKRFIRTSLISTGKVIINDLK